MDLNAITSNGAFRLQDHGEGISVLSLDVPDRSVNVLTRSVLEELEKILQAIAADPAIKGLVVANGKEGSRTFIAGADLDDIRSVRDPEVATGLARRGQEVFSGFQKLPQPVVIALSGTCLGGGAELTLACDLRIAADDPSVEIGFPEVLLGIIPGFGGSQRLPRLVGIRTALDLILTGKRIDPRKAAKIGLVDRVVAPPLLLDSAVALAREAVRRGKRWRPSRKRKLGPRLGGFLIERTPWGRKAIRRAALRSIAQKTGGHYPAPPRAVEAVLQGTRRSLAEGLKLEAEIAGRLVVTPEAKNLVRLFQAGETLRREPRGERTERERDGARRAPRWVGILGAGVMGGAIAALLARRGYRVRIKDIRPEPLSQALAHAARSFDELVTRRRITRNERDNLLASISATTDASGLRQAEVVIEAVVEELEVKRQVVREIEPLLSPEALFATNTSALSVSAIQEAAARPERVVGLHFFNPVHRMPLVEVVQGAKSSEGSLQAAERLARRLGKYPLRVKDGPGFLVNRLFMPYLNEAAHLFVEGCPMTALDQALRDFGFPMGPFELLDEVGLDVARKVGHILHAALGARAAPPPLLEKLVGESKLLGKKGGAGFYLHGKNRVPNPAVLGLNRLPAGQPLPSPDPAGWERRMLYPMVNEAALCLEEGIVGLPEEVDVATVMGMAFPPFRGGLLSYADQTGLGTILEALKGLASGPAPGSAERYRPAELLVRLASEGRTFGSLGKLDGAGEPAAVAAPQTAAAG